MHQNLKWLSQIEEISLKFKKPEAARIQTRNYPKNLIRQSL
jgi:hypothetical protein